LVVGVFLNSLAQVPFSLIQGVGRPDLTAKLHVAEMPFYLLVLWLLISKYGIVGVAMAWTLRVGLDAAALVYISQRLLPECVSASRQTMVTAVGGLAIFLSATLATTPAAKVIFLSTVLLGFVFGGWVFALTPEERTLFRARLRPVEVSINGD
jgi:O-antigen/teichoic acid export membrane protein